MNRWLGVCLLSVMVIPWLGASGQVYIFGPQSTQIGPSARAAGMGGCFIAVADDASASHYNPGGLAFVEGDLNVTAMYSDLVPDWEGISYWQGAASYRVAGWGTFAASFTNLDYGTQMITDDEGNLLGEAESGEQLVSIGMGTAVGDHFGIGWNLRHARMKVASEAIFVGENNREAYAAEIGCLARFPHHVGDHDGLLRLGAVGHMSSPTYYHSEYDDEWLPSASASWEIGLGVSYQLAHGNAFRGLVCLDDSALLIPGSDYCTLGFGLELETSALALSGSSLGLRDRIVGRVGYVDSDGGTEDYSFGFGVGLDWGEAGGVMLDFANVPQPEGLTRPWRYGGSAWIDF